MRTHYIPKRSVSPALGLLTFTVDSSHPRTIVIAAFGDVDMATGPLFQYRLNEWIRSSGPDLVVDLIGVRFFGAAGVSVLVVAAASAKAAGVGFLVVAASRVVLMPLRITGLRDAFGLHSTVSQALERIRAGSPTASATLGTPLANMPFTATRD